MHICNGVYILNFTHNYINLHTYDTERDTKEVKSSVIQLPSTCWLSLATFSSVFLTQGDVLPHLPPSKEGGEYHAVSEGVTSPVDVDFSP